MSRSAWTARVRWIDNVFIERLWRSVKYENIYLRAYENGTQLRRGLTEYFDFYNTRRTHQALDYQTPDDVYYGGTAVQARGMIGVERNTINGASAATRQTAWREDD